MEEKSGILNTGKGKSQLQKLPENSSHQFYVDSTQNPKKSDKLDKRLLRRKEGRHVHTGKGTQGRKETHQSKWSRRLQLSGSGDNS